MVVWWWFACRPGPEVVVGPDLDTPPDTPLARRLTLRTDRPATLTATFTVNDVRREVTFDTITNDFDVPLLGFPPGRTTPVALRLDDGRGVTELDPVDVVTDPLPDEFPAIDVLLHDADRAEPALWLLSLEVPKLRSWLAIYDVADEEIVWLYDGTDWGDVHQSVRGTLIGLSPSALEMDLLGNEISGWTTTPETPTDRSIAWVDLQHELFPLEDGSLLSLSEIEVRAEHYPRSYEDPIPLGPAAVADHHVVWFEADGSTRADWSLAERLETTRIGFGSLGYAQHGYDWIHANAVIPEPDGGVIVSARHQDALVALDPAGDLRWILGDPAGWSDISAPYLLTPTPGTTWPYHAHGPDLVDGDLVLFDNRMFTHTPYTPEPPDPPTSRVVAYRVDPDVMTVTELWSWWPPGGLLSNALGSADWLPETGHVLADFGFLLGEGAITNDERGWGNRNVRIVEIAPGETDPVVDVRLRTDPAIAPTGVSAYRVEPIRSLYGPTATLRRLD